MSYLVLARKWRPQTFDEVVGQKTVVQTLKNALRRNRVAHAMIFSGVRGVGKTTLARIMAKALNCHDPEKAPCNSCSSCREVAEGHALDLHEIDGASNRGIQEIRELKENIRFQPSRERFKIIIIDEVHMLTTEAFNALLKTLEEPPEHVYFMFATTELHKVPVTILSRCQRYELKRVSLEELAAFFAKIAEQEQVAIDQEALEAIAREAEGSVRDGLSLLDQIFSYGGENIGVDDLRQVLGLVDRQIFIRLAKALLHGDLAACFDIFNGCYEQGLDLKRFANDLLLSYRALMVCKSAKDPAALLNMSDHHLQEYQVLAEEYSPETIYQHFNLLLKGVEEMQHASHPRMSLEMTFIKMIQSGDIESVATLLAKLDALPGDEVQESGVGPGPRTSPPEPQAEKQSEPQASGASPEKKSEIEAPATPEPPQPEPVAQPEPEEVPPPAQQPSEEMQKIETTQAGPIVEGRDVRRYWEGFLEHVKERKAWMAHVLALVANVKEKDHELILKFEDLAECKVLREAEHMKMLTEFAQDFFQKEFVIRVTARGGGSENGVVLDAPQEERRALAQDPLVQMAAEVLGGQIKGIRTGPRSR